MDDYERMELESEYFSQYDYLQEAYGAEARDMARADAYEMTLDYSELYDRDGDMDELPAQPESTPHDPDDLDWLPF